MNWLRRIETQGIYPSFFAVTPNSVLPLQPEARITANSQEYIGKQMRTSTAGWQLIA